MNPKYWRFVSGVVLMMLALNLTGGTVTDTIKPLPFTENWSSGGFTANGWSFPWGQGNWQIDPAGGNPQPCVIFPGQPAQSNYISCMQTPWLDATDLTCDDIWLNFDLKLDNLQATGTEKFRVELQHDSVTRYLFIVDNDSTRDWRTINWKIPDAMGKMFRLRFIFYGQNSTYFSTWGIDNISVVRKCKTPENLAATASSHCDPCFVTLWWMPPQCAPAGIPMNFYWDDGTPETGYNQNPGIIGWLGNEFPVSSYSGILESFDLYFINTAGSTSQWLTLDIFDSFHALIGSSGPFSTIPGDFQNVPVGNIPFFGSFYAMVKWNNQPAVSDCLGYDLDGNYVADDLEWYYDGTTFRKLSDPGVIGADPGNFLVRAHALVNEKKMIIRPGQDPVPDSSLLLGYNVYREAFFDTTFLKLNTSLISNPPFVDYNLAADQYCTARYYVTAVFSNGCESDPVPEHTIYMACPTGIENQERSSGITVFPQPADDHLDIRTTIPLTNVTVFDLTGNPIKKFSCSKKSELTIETSSLADGLYILHIETEGKAVSRRMVVIH
jgi:hypothetical protein